MISKERTEVSIYLLMKPYTTRVMNEALLTFCSSDGTPWLDHQQVMVVKKAFSKWPESHCLPGADSTNVSWGEIQVCNLQANFQAKDTERLRLRFVDGVLSIAKRMRLLSMLEHVNKLKSAITFMMEVMQSLQKLLIKGTQYSSCW